MSRWKYFTNVEKVSLAIQYTGVGTVYLNCIDNTRKETLLKSITLNSIDINEARIELDGEFNFYFFSWEEGQKNNLKILQAWYETDRSTIRDNLRIAVVIPTYQRPEDIHNTLLQFYSFLDESRNDGDACDRWHLFVVNNDKSFSIKKDDRHAHDVTILVNQENIGGSSAYAQGAKLAVVSGLYTHVLFMDDDARILPECWRRTHAFLSHLKEKFWGHPVSGAMFERELPNYCHALIEAQNKVLKRIPICCDRELDTAERTVEFLSQSFAINTEFIEEIGRKSYVTPYAQWWYALFPVETFLMHGYPAPYFFSGDDMEFSLRIGKCPIYLNGIQIWHPNFAKKASPLRYYLSIRNYMHRCQIHLPYWKRRTRNFMLRKSLRCLAANDYESCALILLAWRDSRNFAQNPKKIDKIHADINAELTRWENRYENGDMTQPPIHTQRLGKNIIPMALTILTLGGALVPSILKRKETVADIMQIGGRWASLKTSFPGDHKFKVFQSEKALRLTVKVMRQWIW